MYATLDAFNFVPPKKKSRSLLELVNATMALDNSPRISSKLDALADSHVKAKEDKKEFIKKMTEKFLEEKIKNNRMYPEEGVKEESALEKMSSIYNGIKTYGGLILDGVELLFNAIIRPIIALAWRALISVFDVVATTILRVIIEPVISGVIALAVANPVTATVLGVVGLAGLGYWAYNKFFAGAPVAATPGGLEANDHQGTTSVTGSGQGTAAYGPGRATSIAPKARAKGKKGGGGGGIAVDIGNGTATDKSMALLRKYEGYIDTAKWDVNHQRLGYGSDTITDANGVVREVVKGDTVTRADAERDLRRRVPIFQATGIIPYTGQRAWDALNSTTQAVVTSLAYNYGSLKKLKSLVTAIKSGNTDDIADEIEALQEHNDGVNRDRRLSEATLVRESGDAATPTATAGTTTVQSPKASVGAPIDPAGVKTQATSGQQQVTNGTPVAGPSTAPGPTQIVGGPGGTIVRVKT